MLGAVCAGWAGCSRDARDPASDAPAAQAVGAAGAANDVSATPVATTGDSITDAAGRRFSAADAPLRIVSLVPSATETLLALGAGDRLVGRTDFDTASVLVALPSVGGGLGPSIEVLVSLKPDLVIRFAGEADPRTPAQLDELGVAHFAVRPDRIEDARNIIRDLGRLTHRTAEAEAVLARIDQHIARVQARVEGLPATRAAFLLDGTPPWAAGPGSYIGELIVLGGGVNVFNDLDRQYAPVSREELVARNMAVVLTVHGTAPGGVPDDVEIRSVSPVTQLPGPRLGEAAEEIARALHPEAFR